MTIEELRKRQIELNETAKAIRAKADAEKRDLIEDEQKELTAALDEFDAVEKEIEQRQRIEDQEARLNRSAGRRTEPNEPGVRANDEPRDRDPQEPSTSRKIPATAIADHGRWGWRSFGEFGKAVIEGSRRGATPDERLTRASLSTFGSEFVGADGGFAVPPDFRNIIMDELLGEDSLLPRTDQLTSGSNNLTVPKDETSPWQTSGGILANWIGESGAITQSKPSLETVTLKLHKLAVLVPLTDELIEDASALTGWLSRKAPQKINFKVNLGIVQGSGSGEPLGILNSSHTVSVAKESSQAADTLVGMNVIKMYSRMYGPWRRNAVWLINQDIEPELFTLMKVGKLDTGAADTGWGVPLYMPANGLSSSPFGTLFGRPVIPTQACETLGDKGDIIFAALNQYVTVQKTAGIRQDTSIHLWFDQDTTAFRFIMRIAGQPWWQSTISARDGTTTYSAFVTLDARA